MTYLIQEGYSARKERRKKCERKRDPRLSQVWSSVVGGTSFYVIEDDVRYYFLHG
jgi:hypothetical protein